MREELAIGTRVKFNICEGMDVGEATIVGSRIENEDGKDCLYYKLDEIVGSQSNLHRNKEGELWVNDFEVRAAVK